MRRIKLNLAYDGTDFHGWQVQPGYTTIQGLLEEAFLQIEKCPVSVAGSGRTDAGVHALAQVAAVSIKNPIPVLNLRKALNRLLPNSIRVNSVEEVEEAFHPRFDAVSKIYEYRIYRPDVCAPFERRYVHHYPYPLDETFLQGAAPLLEGTHDFTAFGAADDRDARGLSRVRTVFFSQVRLEPDRIIYRIQGSGFLKHMVRNIAGTLIEIGKHNLTYADIMQFLKRPAPKAGPRAPASGLFLIKVHY